MMVMRRKKSLVRRSAWRRYQPILTEEDVHVQSCLKDRNIAKINRDFDVINDIRD